MPVNVKHLYLTTMRWWCLIICFISFTLSLAGGAKILGVFPMASHSHFTLGFRLMKELADRGHEVTVINPFPQKVPIKNYRDVSVEDIVGNIDDKLKELYDMGQKTVLGQIKWVTDMGLFFTENTLKNKNVQKLLKSNEKFDLVIMENFVNDAYMIFAEVFKCPLVLLAPGPTTIFNNHLFANPSTTSYVPNIVANFGSRMTFWQRFKNLYYNVAGDLYRELVVLPKHAQFVKENVPGAPDLYKILYNASLLLLTSHISLHDPSPKVPAIKEIGGFHIQPPKPLPKDLKEYLDNAKEGVIIFSMGSNLKSSALPEDKKKAILTAFSKIKQKVIWKFEDDLPEKPNNVKIMKWLPQQDILAHPNVKAFITHGGLLGTIETVYHGVPLIGIPVFWDQELNVENAVNKGYAVKISFRDLTEERLSSALNEVLHNPKYRENVKIRSKIIHDEPVKPLDLAVHWIEYVIRHQGAPHLRAAGVDLVWYQRNLLDIILVLTIVTIVLFVIFYIIIKKILGLTQFTKNVKVGKTKKNK